MNTGKELSLNILSINVRGLNDKRKREKVFYWLRKQNVDIIALQETHLGGKSDEWKWKREWNNKSVWTNVSKSSKGVAILTGKQSKIELINTKQDPNGRLISVDVKSQGEKLRIVNVYAPNNDQERKKFIQNEIESHVTKEGKNILVGDFNCTLGILDRIGNVNRIEQGREELVNLMSRLNLVDVFREIFPNKREYTYFKPNSQTKSRIDNCLVTHNLYQWAREVGTKPASFSDHNAVYIQLNIGQVEKGKGRWKMNKQVIMSDLFRDTFTHFWRTWSHQ